MSNNNRKSLSDTLVGLRGKKEVLAFLSDAGYDVARAAKTLIGSDQPTGALLVGSVAEGFQTASSDVDILLLTYAERDDIDVTSRLLIESGQSLEMLSYATGVEINTEIICREDYEPLAGRLDQVSGSIALGGEMTKLPMIDNYSLRFLHRLRSGITLFGDEVVDEFRTDFHVRSLPLYLSVKYLVLARESLEDVRSSPESVEGLVEFICRDIIEHSLLAIAASQGFTSQSRRFVMNWISALMPDNPHYELLTELRRQVLTRNFEKPTNKKALVAEVTAVFEAAYSVLREDQTRRKVIDHIFSRIAYAE